MEKKTIGSLISALRRAAGMTQRDLAEQLNVSDKAVSRWERDESAPDLTLLPVIADLFGITVDELLRGQRRPAADVVPAIERTADREESAPAPAGTNTKRQKMLFGNRLRKQRMLNYIPLGLFAVGVVAALLCNFAFYRAALGFFLGLLFELAAVICALAFGSAAMPVSEEDYDAALLQDYKRSVIRTTYLPVYLATLTSPMLAALLFTWLDHGAYVGLAASSGLLLLLLVTLIVALLLREIANYGVLPAIARKHGVTESEREAQHRAGIKRLAKKCILAAAGGMVLPVVALGVLNCGMLDPDTAFAHKMVFTDFDEFRSFMASEGEYGTTEHWSWDDFYNGGMAREILSLGVNSPPWESVDVEISIEVGSDKPPREDTSDVTANALQHRVIEDGDGKILAEFDWINADVAYIEWNFNAAGDNLGLPIVVFTVDEVLLSHTIYDALILIFGVLLAAAPISAAVVYVVKRKKV